MCFFIIAGIDEPLKGTSPASIWKKHHAETVDIRTRVRLLVRPLFGRHVIRRTHQARRLRLDERTEKLARLDLGQTKIEYLDRLRQVRLVAADHDVQRLEIAMNDALVMRRADAGTHRDDHFQGSFRGERLFACEQS